MYTILLITALSLLLIIFAGGLLINWISGDHRKNPAPWPNHFTGQIKTWVEEGFADLPRWADYHVHLVALNDPNKGFVNVKMQRGMHWVQRFKFAVYRRSGGITDLRNADDQYCERLRYLLAAMPIDGETYLLAMDKYYDKKGESRIEKTPFYVSNAYAFQVAHTLPSTFPVISTHPYQKSAIAQLIAWHEKGVHFVKWLPNSMGIDPSSPDNIPFYETLVKLNMVLLTHTGVEAAVHASKQAYGNPLHLRLPLALGVKILMAHVGSLGVACDYENKEKPMVPCFELALRLLDDEQYASHLFADISGITLINRPLAVLNAILERQDLHHRLVYGSDYPICAIQALIQTRRLQKNGFITAPERQMLNAIYRYNPILFDFMVKRSVRSLENQKQFLASVFQPHPALAHHCLKTI